MLSGRPDPHLLGRRRRSQPPRARVPPRQFPPMSRHRRITSSSHNSLPAAQRSHPRLSLRLSHPLTDPWCGGNGVHGESAAPHFPLGSSWLSSSSSRSLWLVSPTPSRVERRDSARLAGSAARRMPARRRQAPSLRESWCIPVRSTSIPPAGNIRTAAPSARTACTSPTTSPASRPSQSRPMSRYR